MYIIFLNADFVKYTYSDFEYCYFRHNIIVFQNNNNSIAILF